MMAQKTRQRIDAPLWVAMVGALIAGSLGGCSDEQGAQRLEAMRSMDQVIEKVRMAQQAFVPQGAEPDIEYELDGQIVHDKQADLYEYRLRLLSEAKDQLGGLIARTGDGQAVAARVLMADIEAILARDVARSGIEHWADVANRGATLLSYCLSVERSRSRVEQFEQSVPVATAELREARSEAVSQATAMEQRRRHLGGAVEALSAKVMSLKQDADLAQARAQQLQGEAISADRLLGYDLVEEAATERRRAQRLLAEAQQHQVSLDSNQEELVFVEASLEQARLAGTTLAEQLEGIEQWHKMASTMTHSEAQSREPVVEDMTGYFDESDRVFNERVDAAFDQAVEGVDRAIALLMDAERHIARGDQRQMQLNRLNYVVDKAHILSSFTLALQSYAGRVGEVAGRIDVERPGLAGQWRARMAEVQVKLAEVSESGSEAVAEGLDLAEQLGANETGESDPIAAAAKQQAERLNLYRGLSESAASRGGPSA